MHRLARFACGLALLTTAIVRGEVTLAPLFRDHAVLQADRPLPIWGRGDPGERITVTFRGETMNATADAAGRWIVVLPPCGVVTDGDTLTVAGKNTLTLHDILVGEVWLCSGQSNMEWPVAQADRAAEEIAAANFPLIRHIKIERTVASAPAEDVATTGWRSATPENVGAFTAVGYFFARDLNRKLGVPIGLVNSTWGGTPIESWMSEVALADPQFAAVHARWREAVAVFPARQAIYLAQKTAWDQAAAQALATHTQNPLPWPQPVPGPGTPYEISGLFNAMINPLLPGALRGVLWYQGESNAARPDEYRALFPALIRSWRQHWGVEDLPFYFVQLSSFQSRDPWPALREAQAAALALPATGMAVTIDIGNPKDIHPRNKQEVGRRLALIARAQLYDLPADFSGPVFASATREGAALRVRFEHVSSGLVAHDRPVQSLQLAGPDRVFHPATAKIERSTLLVTSPAVKEPVAVRYAWESAPAANLFNGAGLPAAPFRSDRW